MTTIKRLQFGANQIPHSQPYTRQRRRLQSTIASSANARTDVITCRLCVLHYTHVVSGLVYEVIGSSHKLWARMEVWFQHVLIAKRIHCKTAK
jgi:hypothetical protein